MQNADSIDRKDSRLDTFINITDRSFSRIKKEESATVALRIDEWVRILFFTDDVCSTCERSTLSRLETVKRKSIIQYSCRARENLFREHSPLAVSARRTTHFRRGTFSKYLVAPKVRWKKLLHPLGVSCLHVIIKQVTDSRVM